MPSRNNHHHHHHHHHHAGGGHGSHSNSRSNSNSHSHSQGHSQSQSYGRSHGRSHNQHHSSSNQHHHSSSNSQHHRSAYDRPRRLVLRERLFSLTGNDFDVTEGRGRNVSFTIRGDSTSLHDARTLRDHAGRAVYRMKVALLSAHGRMYVKHCGTGDTLVTLRRKTVVPFAVMGGGTVRVWRGEREEGQPWLEVHGDHYGRQFVIEDGVWGDEVVTIRRRSFSIPYLLLGRCSYVMHLRPGCNAALMVFLVVAIHDYFRDE